MNTFTCKGLEDCCPECGNVIFYRKDSTEGYYCNKAGCNYGYATTYIPQIARDTTPYTVFVLSLGENWKQNIVFLSLKFNISINEARHFKIPGKLLLTADAGTIFHVRQQLKKRSIEIQVVPNYPYEVWDNSPQGEFTLSSVEAKKFKSLLEQN